jgi:hypothetical protein
MAREGEVMLEGYTHADYIFSISAGQVVSKTLTR